jgi:antitoxin (DNA-binding transcriptional repressor) of toxin-antitoxin stability system
MTTITVEEAQAQLSQLLRQLGPGEEIVITEGERPLAKLIGQPRPPRKPRQPGTARGKLILREEDDEHLKDFEEYLGRA